MLLNLYKKSIRMDTEELIETIIECAKRVRGQLLLTGKLLSSSKPQMHLCL